METVQFSRADFRVLATALEAAMPGDLSSGDYPLTAEEGQEIRRIISACSWSDQPVATFSTDGNTLEAMLTLWHVGAEMCDDMPDAQYDRITDTLFR